MNEKSPSIGRMARAALGLTHLGLCAMAAAVTGLVLAWRSDSELIAQNVLQQGFRSCLWLWRRLGLVEVTTSGVEGLGVAGPLLVVSNHPSLMDTPAIGALMPQADLVVSESYARNPVLAGAVRAAGYISNVEGAQVVEKVVERLRAGRSVVIFPEGTRSPEEGLGKFHRGAAHAALRSGCDLIPVVITVEPRKLMKGQGWYDLPEQPIQMRLRVLEPLSPSKLLNGAESGPMAARKVTAALRERYERELNGGE